MRSFKSEISYRNVECGDGCCSWSYMNILIMDVDSGECILDDSIETWNPYNKNDVIRVLNDTREIFWTKS